MTENQFVFPEEDIGITESANIFQLLLFLLLLLLSS
jgi:hypothetical protein